MLSKLLKIKFVSRLILELFVKEPHLIRMGLIVLLDVWYVYGIAACDSRLVILN